MTEAAIKRYWCHECEHGVDIEEAMAEDMKCPFCDGGFIEEMAGEEFEGLIRQRSERDLSQWGASDNLFEQPGGTANSEDDDEEEDDDMGREFEGFIRRHRRVSALRRVLDSIQDDLRADRERGNSVLINAFNQALALQGSVLDPDEVRDDQGSSSHDDGLLEEYVLGAGLSLLLQHLAESDPNRYGTPPAKKEAVEALPTVTVEEVVSCSVCLDDLELGSEAKQMPCEHKFHSPCILPWLELHSSCPVPKPCVRVTPLQLAYFHRYRDAADAGRRPSKAADFRRGAGANGWRERDAPWLAGTGCARARGLGAFDRLVACHLSRGGKKDQRCARHGVPDASAADRDGHSRRCRALRIASQLLRWKGATSQIGFCSTFDWRRHGTRDLRLFPADESSASARAASKHKASKTEMLLVSFFE
nr:unnamed protein product [Digitaria exilis]